MAVLLIGDDEGSRIRKGECNDDMVGVVILAVIVPAERAVPSCAAGGKLVSGLPILAILRYNQKSATAKAMLEE